MALALPHDEPARSREGGTPASVPGRLRTTLTAPGPWLIALCFGVYAAQWMAVIGFLPSIYATAGFPAGLTAVLTALAAAANIGGNVVGGRLLQRGIAAPRLLMTAFGLMGLGTALAFGEWPGATGAVALPPAARYLAVIGFSLAGGMAPATLFSLAIRLAPSAATVSTTVGWMQQWSSFGQVVLPPLVAWITARAGGWQWTWLVTGACSLAGMALSLGIGRLQRCRAGEVSP
ncbi:MAG: transporter-like protein, partial [Variovorax sp.]|nr:transporter-like protein [Variovorax sp.]